MENYSAGCDWCAMLCRYNLHRTLMGLVIHKQKPVFKMWRNLQAISTALYGFNDCKKDKM